MMMIIIISRAICNFKHHSIDGAISFPVIRLRQDKCPNELYSFKNAKDKIIVVYAEDSVLKTKRGVDAATAMVLKVGSINH
jgi:hypothetical protein